MTIDRWFTRRAALLLSPALLSLGAPGPLLAAEPAVQEGRGSKKGAGGPIDGPVAELLAGVEDIAAPGTPSPLSVWSNEASVILCGNSGQGLKAPAVVAGRSGPGRFVLLAHNGYFGPGVLAKGQTGRFLVNATKWAAGTKSGKPKVAARGQELVDLLNESGFEAHLLGAAPLAEDLEKVDAVVGITSDLEDGDHEPLERFLYRGGGIIAGQCAWGWMQQTGATSLQGNSLNRFFGNFGVAWADGYLGKVGEVGFTAERAPPKLTHGDAALTYLRNHQDKTDLENLRPMLQAAATATTVVQLLPADDHYVRPGFRVIEEKLATAIVPSPEEPLLQVDGMRRVLLALHLSDAARAAPGSVTPLASARLFPGEVPEAAARVTRSVEIDTAIPRWHSTGLYAAAGQAVTITLPKEAVGPLVLQIGCHTDELWQLEEWHRAPAIVRRAELAQERTIVASPFGGLIYVDVPEACALGKVAVEIGPAIEAPRFVRGRTTVEEWQGAQRNHPAPWAELEGERVIVTVPSAAIRGLDDPEALMKLWDRAADAAAELVALPRARPHPERFVADVQIAAGSMHSGYPVMTHLDATPAMTEPARLARGDWGLFHELGHNHQSEDWTFDGTGEVTNNVICLYVLDTVCGRTPFAAADAGDPLDEPLFGGFEHGVKAMPAYFAAGAKFDEWKEQPFLALQMYAQIQQGFGWKAYRDVFAAYRGLPRREKPKDDDAKRDLWLVMLSRACERNLGPFFTAWGVPTSEAARASVAALPEWMPPSFPPR